MEKRFTLNDYFLKDNKPITVNEWPIDKKTALAEIEMVLDAEDVGRKIEASG